MDLKDYLHQSIETEREITQCLYSLMTDEQFAVIQNNPILIRSNKSISRADLFCPKGIAGLELTGPTMVEIKNSLQISTYQNEFAKGQAYVADNPDNYYLVVYWRTSLVFPDIKKTGRVLFMSYDKLKSSLEDAKNVNLTNQHKSNDNRNNHSESVNLVDKAAAALKHGPVSFVLGAGVSVDAGSPNWNDLLCGLLEANERLRPIGKRADDYQSINRHCGWSTLISARYVIKDDMPDKDLIKKLRHLIYTREKRDYINDPTSIQVIAKMVQAYQTNVEGIITFNYDEFMEEELEANNVKHASFFNKGALVKDEVPVFHVHGLISRDIKKPSSRPVLSEREYHLLYSNDFHWSNVEILRALIRTTCFFVGLSMVDPNLRRLLDIAKYDDSESCRHFLFMKRSPLDEGNPNPKFDEMHWTQMERQFAQMGVNVIWFDANPNNPADYSNLAEKMKEILTRSRSNDI